MVSAPKVGEKNGLKVQIQALPRAREGRWMGILGESQARWSGLGSKGAGQGPAGAGTQQAALNQASWGHLQGREPEAGSGAKCAGPGRAMGSEPSIGRVVLGGLQGGGKGCRLNLGQHSGVTSSDLLPPPQL